jgi:hypothetical protein
MRHDPTVIPLDTQLAEALLGADTVVDLTRKREALRQAVAVIEATLAAHPLTRMVAEKVAHEARLKGTPEVRVSPQGVLNVVIPPTDTKWNSTLPPLKVLRQDAAALGVDISKMGRNKKAIVKALAAARAPAPAAPIDRPKRMKTGVSVLPPVMLNPSTR